MFLPEEVKKVISMLENSGCEAFAVGGCVRDSLLGKVPTDYDVTTSAFPEEMKAVLKNEHVIETGIKHGTLTVLINKNPIEITTFRIDKDYLDNRRPEKVLFTRSLEEDLARRDFTINALAYNEKTGIIDIFGGTYDLEHGIIRTVGDANARFNEDALRIMRALRFSSVLGFEIEEKTATSVFENRRLLKNISAERIFSELTKLLCGKNAKKVIFEHCETIFEIIPELSVLKGFDQHHFRHYLDAFEHTLAVLENVPPIPELRLAALFHDIAKPLCQSFDENGTGHYYGHAQKSAEIAETVLKRLRADGETIKTVSELVRRHEDRFDSNPKAVKRLLGKIGPELFEKLLLLMEADEHGKREEFRLSKTVFDEFHRLASEITEKGECFSLKDLAVNGSDLISAGFEPGKQMGEILGALLEKVIEGEIPNEKESLLAFAKQYNIIHYLKKRRKSMKKLFVLFLSLVMVLSFSACGGRKTPSGVPIPEDDGVVDNIVIDGEEISAVDFVIESCNKYIASEQYKEVNGFFVENFGEAIPFTVTRVIDLKAYGLSQCKMNIHYLLIKTECNWATEENGEIFSSDNLLLVADYDTGEVWSEFDKDEAWFEDGEKKEYWTYVMLNGPLVGSSYDCGAIVGDNVETRAEFTAEDIAAVNAGIVE